MTQDLISDGSESFDVQVQTLHPRIWLRAKRAVVSPEGTVRFASVFRTKSPTEALNEEHRLTSSWETSVRNLDLTTARGIEWNPAVGANVVPLT